MSEAGCPGVADPGAVLAAAAQEIGATVVPLTGPSSILLALMASGFNGQGFRFAGYLPVKEPMRGKAIKELESISAERNETQIFIETPYRNNQLFQDVMRLCKHGTKLCIAASITDEREFIQTKTVAEWAKQAPELHKKPVIFLLMA
jgi:16S rRNA (cytidine1402-2'-O)-methyltransferase